jgi:hypothetical protein
LRILRERGLLMTRFDAFMLLLALSAPIGCSSTRELSADNQNAEAAISMAEKAGAKHYAPGDMELAREDLRRAKVSEAAALEDRSAARQQLETMRKRDQRAERRLQYRRAELAQVEEERRAHDLALQRLTEHAAVLREKGLPEEEVSAIVDPQTAMTKVKIRQLEAQSASLEKEIAAMENIRKDSALQSDAARARLRSAEDRLQASRATYQEVQDRANLARSRALDGKRAELSDSITKISQ